MRHLLLMPVEIPSPRYSLCRWRGRWCWSWQQSRSYHSHAFAAFYRLWSVALVWFRCSDCFRRYFRRRRYYRPRVLTDRSQLCSHNYCLTFDLEHHSNGSQVPPMNSIVRCCLLMANSLLPKSTMDLTISLSFALAKWLAVQVADWLSLAVAAASTITLDLLQLLAEWFDYVCLVERKQHDPVFVGGVCREWQKVFFLFIPNGGSPRCRHVTFVQSLIHHSSIHQNGLARESFEWQTVDRFRELK